MKRTLQGIYDLTLNAMESIDGAYWRKCISHMRKEIKYYQMHDGMISKEQGQAAIQMIEPTISTDYEMEIPVSFFFHCSILCSIQLE